MSEPGRLALWDIESVRRRGSADASRESPFADPENAGEPYKYSPLNAEAQEIRLLTLLPGAFDSEVRICLDITPFTESHVPEFEAVSYAWGSTENPVQILIGKVGRKTLAITQNLAEALPYFRQIDKPRVLWIDAICVDQQNLPERGQQVKRMAAIYSKAIQVLVWLGPQSDDSSIVFDLIERINKHVKINELATGLIAISEETSWADPTTKLPLTKAEHFALYAFVNRPWFKRLWVLQEVHLATGSVIVLCGSKISRWLDLCVVVQCLIVKGCDGIREIKAVDFNNRLDHISDICISLPKGYSHRPDDLIARTTQCLCSDPRDKIFALLSLWDSNVGIEPDYSKDVHEVYQQATLSLIEHFNNLNVLSTVEHHERIDRIPSWVPNWAEPQSYHRIELCFASHNTVLTLPLGHSGNILKVEGIIISTIRGVIPMFGRNEEWTDKKLVVKLLKEVATLTGLREDSSQNDQHKIFARILSTNLFAQRYSPPIGELLDREEVEAVMSRILRSGTDAEAWYQNCLEKPLNTVLRRCNGRAFYVTDNETKGLAPMAAKQGDIVTVLLGCDFPMILRPARENSYQVVGEAYCDGFMEGEGLLGPLPQHFVAVGRQHQNSSGGFFYVAKYLNQMTGHFQIDDPRLGVLPSGWSIKSHKDEEYWQAFLNEETGKETWEDPRLTSDELRKRGVPLEIFELI